MVKVGSFWIDRYEVTRCGGIGVLGNRPGHDTTAAACSTKAKALVGGVSWLQAGQLCVNAGKRLCTNAEWPAAVAGTFDPGSWNGDLQQCKTSGMTTRQAGNGAACRSRFGAEDMIGNVGEWVADWHASPRTSAPAEGPGGCWGSNFGSDRNMSVAGGAYDDDRGAFQRVPAAVYRGGSSNDGDDAGAFAFSVYGSPSFTSGHVGVRCCR